MAFKTAHICVLLISVGLSSSQSTKDHCDAGDCEQTEVEVLRGLLINLEKVSTLCQYTVTIWKTFILTLKLWTKGGKELSILYIFRPVMSFLLGEFMNMFSKFLLLNIFRFVQILQLAIWFLQFAQIYLTNLCYYSTDKKHL